MNVLALQFTAYVIPDLPQQMSYLKRRSKKKYPTKIKNRKNKLNKRHSPFSWKQNKHIYLFFGSFFPSAMYLRRYLNFLCRSSAHIKNDQKFRGTLTGKK